GKRQLLTTTTSTIQQRFERIEWTTLPPTFQDAITLAAKLGYQYLWIDSLCIVQDDKKDWEMQSSQIGQIYMSYAIMISALSVKDSSIGCFRTNKTEPIHFAVPGPGAQSFSFYVEEEASHAGIDDFKADLDASPLATRAWALQ
ncbi:HET domain protein pin-c2, partial [Halenospora varia]